MKTSDYRIKESSQPISLRDMPYTLNIRALLAYVRENGLSVESISEEEKKQFLIPNSQYKKKKKVSIAAAIL